ncbi:MAG: hypothetical protein H7257_14270 [Taibaiella sp.]|nr:hypothetical protein [Taibaiella sp.]
MFKKLLLLGIVSGIMAAVASLIYQKVYASSLGADFAAIVKIPGIFISCVLGGVLAAVGYWLLQKWLKTKTEIVFNLLYTIISFASIVGPFAMKLPLEAEMPELFPGLTVPMHFFPALA